MAEQDGGCATWGPETEARRGQTQTADEIPGWNPEETRGGSIVSGGGKGDCKYRLEIQLIMIMYIPWQILPDP